MIRPVGPPQSIPTVESERLEGGRARESSPLFDSLIFHPARTKNERRWNRVIRLLSRLFRPLRPLLLWLENNVLCHFIDLEEERRISLYLKMARFKDQRYFDAQGTIEERETAFRSGFKKLPEILQKRINGELRFILKEIFPEEDWKAVDERVKEAFAEPFKELEDTKKPKEQAIRLVMGEALTKVASKLAVPR